jgi:hypothetical protein
LSSPVYIFQLYTAYWLRGGTTIHDIVPSFQPGVRGCKERLACPVTKIDVKGLRWTMLGVYGGAAGERLSDVG